MNGFLWLLVVCTAVWAVGALVTLGVLAERERLQNADGERGWRWWCALVFSAVAWPFVAALWPDSRPVPSPQPPRGESLPTYENTAWSRVPTSMVRRAIAVVATSRFLRDMTLVQDGQPVWIESVGVAVVRLNHGWQSTSCACWWNDQGWPQVVCRFHQRVHRTDLDPQGEPDEDEGSVGL